MLDNKVICSDQLGRWLSAISILELLMAAASERIVRVVFMLLFDNETFTLKYQACIHFVLIIITLLICLYTACSSACRHIISQASVSYVQHSWVQLYQLHPQQQQSWHSKETAAKLTSSQTSYTSATICILHSHALPSVMSYMAQPETVMLWLVLLFRSARVSFQYGYY